MRSSVLDSLCLVAFMVCIPCGSAPAGSSGFVPLFPEDGIPEGWVVRHWADVSKPAPEGAVWRVKDGILRGSTPRGTWLMSEREFADFELKFEFKLGPRGNSGCALRSPMKGDPAFDGLELQMADLRYNPRAKPSELTGGLYRAAAPSKQVYRPESWNRYHIVLRGSKAHVTLNGTVILDIDLSRYNETVPRHDGSPAPALKDRPLKGHIGFQELSRGGDHVQIRNAGIKVLKEAPPAGSKTLKIFLLCGQSNMEGDGYTHMEGDTWLAGIGYPKATSLEFLVDNPAYLKSLDADTYTMLSAFTSEWLTEARSDAWAVHMDCATGKPFRLQNTRKSGKESWKRQEGPLQPGFGRNANDFSRFGPELGLGHFLGERLISPLYFYKSDHGGTALATAWRPPSAVKKRGGAIGDCFKKTMKSFKGFLKALDATLKEKGSLSDYGNATEYEVCAFVWLQGWNDSLNADRKKEYKDNLIDLVKDVRSQLELPGLPAVIVESADTDKQMNSARKEAVSALNSEHPGSAVFVPAGDLKAGYRGGFHFEARAENFLEIGWRAGKAILENRYAGSRPEVSKD